MGTKAALLIPKTTPRPEFVPALPDTAFPWLTGDLGPPEHRALRESVLRGDLAEVDGRRYLVTPVSDETIDALAAFEAEGEDRELDNSDDAFDAVNGVAIMDDFEPDCPEAHQRFIAERAKRAARSNE